MTIQKINFSRIVVNWLNEAILKAKPNLKVKQ